MALWRDPLEELIGELDRVLPSQAGPGQFDAPPPFEDVQLAVHAVLWGDSEHLALAARDPRIQAVWAYLERVGTRINREA